MLLAQTTKIHGWLRQKCYMLSSDDHAVHLAQTAGTWLAHTTKVSIRLAQTTGATKPFVTFIEPVFQTSAYLCCSDFRCVPFPVNWQVPVTLTSPNILSSRECFSLTVNEPALGHMRSFVFNHLLWAGSERTKQITPWIQTTLWSSTRPCTWTTAQPTNTWDSPRRNLSDWWDPSIHSFPSSKLSLSVSDVPPSSLVRALCGRCTMLWCCLNT